MNLADKKIIVTGGSSGYGFGIAKALIRQNAKVTILGRNIENLKKAAAEIGSGFIQCDITEGTDWDRVFEHCPDVDVLINNAGAAVKVAPLSEQIDADIYRSINTNLTGALLGCTRASKIMKEKKSGLIINISSICALYGWPGYVAYSSAKAGLNMMSRTLYTELRPFNVRVTVVTPSWGDTNFMTASKRAPLPDHLREQSMSPDEMGNLIVQICETPDHLFYPEIMIQPVVQEIIPF